MQRAFAVLFRLLACALVLPLFACGGGGDDSGGPSGPSAPSTPTHSVQVRVFYDENDNGQHDTGEVVRIPGVRVVIGGVSGTTAVGTGRVTLTGVPEGSHVVALTGATLPPFYRAAAQDPIQVPGVAAFDSPLVLPIGDNHPNRYLGFGDDLTYGIGSSDGRGYGPKLQERLASHLGRAEVLLKGRTGDISKESAEVAKRTIRDPAPAYTLILLGTNDWTHKTCQDAPAADCFTIDALRSIVREAKAWSSLPVLGTLPPVNPAMAPVGRRIWVEDTNRLIRALAADEGAALADIEAAFEASGDLPTLFIDAVFPNDAGYDAMTNAWFEAITGTGAAAASGYGRFGFESSSGTASR